MFTWVWLFLFLLPPLKNCIVSSLLLYNILYVVFFFVLILIVDTFQTKKKYLVDWSQVLQPGLVVGVGATHVACLDWNSLAELIPL